MAIFNSYVSLPEGINIPSINFHPSKFQGLLPTEHGVSECCHFRVRIALITGLSDRSRHVENDVWNG
jgi:hypothetical protein